MMPLRPLLFLLVVAACSSSDSRAVAVGGEHHGKPSALVDLVLAATPLGGHRYDVTLTARPAVDGRAMLLEVLLPHGTVVESGGSRKLFPAVRAGDVLTLGLRVRLVPGDADLFGSARVAAASGRRLTRSRVVHTRVGRARVLRMSTPRTVVLPSGDRIAEVRP